MHHTQHALAYTNDHTIYEEMLQFFRDTFEHLFAQETYI